MSLNVNLIDTACPTDVEAALHHALEQMCRDTLVRQVDERFQRPLAHPDPDMATCLRRTGSLIPNQLPEALQACVIGKINREKLERLVELSQAALQLHDLRIQRFQDAFFNEGCRPTTPKGRVAEAGLSLSPSEVRETVQDWSTVAD